MCRGDGSTRGGWVRGLLAIAALVCAAAPAPAAVSVGGWMQHSPDDIAGFTTISGDTTASVTLPFTFTVEGTNYTTIVVSTNGWIEFGSNTSGTSDDSNDCLPTAAHTNPFLAAYWDDLNPFGTAVRYGTVGSANGRVFVVDYEVDLVAGVEGQDDLRFQIQLHERSNLITVRFRDTQNAANGQDATIGFQGAGGASATTVQPITCNGKVLDDNRPDEGWSADVGRAGLVTLAGHLAHSPDDLPGGFASLTGNNAIAGATMPFSVSIEGTSYNTLTIGTNGMIQFGTTTGNNPTGNTALPSSSFPNPTLFYYWDDLQTEGSNIRYGVIGSSPNRTYIVDFQMNTVAASGDKVNGQVQIHERSGLINVKYRPTISAGANGQSATIGFQGAGGAAAVAYPITFNGKVLDDNRPDEGFSLHPMPFGAVSLHAVMEHSPDDISGFATLTGNDVIAGVTLPFTVRIDSVNYTQITIGSNGLVQFGTLTGANPGANANLPSASFSGPTLFYYWDDLQTEGGNIRHGVVGSSPHRTYIVDFQENTVAASGNKVNGQVQIHEGSNLINVKYRSTFSAGSNGQSATVGFQSAGGAAATAHLITFNGKVFDDNLPDAGWSVAPLPVCGNGVIETQEDCDAGGANGTLASCCSSSCDFKVNGTACTDDGNGCTNDQCNGASATCQHPNNTAPCSDGLFCNGTDTCAGGGCTVHSGDPCVGPDGDVNCAESCNEGADNCSAADPDGTSCRADAGECDVAETCLAGVCPPDGFEPASTPCGSGSDTDCDNPDTCNGAGACAINNEPPTTICRPDAGECDVVELCDGAGSCPANDFEPLGTACGDLSDTDCSNPDSCDGAGACAPNNEPNTTICRADAGECDVVENCDGAGACPADDFEPLGTACGDNSDTDCSNPDACDGAGACDANHEANTVVCRAASPGQLCDAVEQCDGAGNCPADGVLPNGTTCRADTGECDVVETCDGVASACPSDAFEANGTACGNPADTDCDNPDTCNGNNFCLANLEPALTACGDPSDSDCTDADSCDGAGSCEANHASSGAACADDGETCTTDTCDGGGLCAHPAGNAGVECRAASAGQLCDQAEQCDGSTPTCPADAVQPTGAVCRADAGDCDLEEQCDGSSSACPADVFESSGTACGDASDTDCTNPDTCDGGGACQANHEATSVVCRAASAGQECDAVESCDGAGNCPADGVLPSGTSCRTAAGECDLAESCDGSSSDCPADALTPSGTTCSTDNNPCTVDECDGSGVCAHPAGNAGAPCRADAGACDVAESCDGLSASCPLDASEPDGTGCSDGLFCNGIDECSAGACVSPGSPCGMGETCNEGSDGCFVGGCPAVPATCATAQKSLLLIKNENSAKDKLVWKWIKGAAASQADFADPRDDAEYAFCLYAGGSLLTSATVPPNATAWQAISDKGFKYKDKTGAAFGIQKILVKGTNVAGKSKALIKGKGINLPFEGVTMPITATPVVAQLRNNATGFCMQGSYSAPIKSTDKQYKAKQ